MFKTLEKVFHFCDGAGLWEKRLYQHRPRNRPVFKLRAFQFGEAWIKDFFPECNNSKSYLRADVTSHLFDMLMPLLW